MEVALSAGALLSRATATRGELLFGVAAPMPGIHALHMPFAVAKVSLCVEVKVLQHRATCNSVRDVHGMQRFSNHITGTPLPPSQHHSEEKPLHSVMIHKCAVSLDFDPLRKHDLSSTS